MHFRLTSILLFLASFGYAQEIRIKPFRDQGGSGSFSPDGRHILYEKKGDTKERYYEIHQTDAAGQNDTCISCRCTQVPQRHNGCSTYHPSGKYIVFTGEKKEHPRSSVDAIPGFGAFTDIWLMSIDSKNAWMLYETQNDYDHGIIAPRFSPDGKHLVWVERKKAPAPLQKKQFMGLWTIRTADFSDADGQPKLSNFKTYEPGGDGFYETYGYSPDGKRIIFMSNMHSDYWWTSQIFTIDAATGGDVQQLTTNDYNEHAIYTPDGKKIIWMTNSYGTTGTDWWMMNADGSMKQPLTYFNSPAYPQQYMGKNVWAGTGFFNADATEFIGGVQTSLTAQEGKVVTVDFLPCSKGNGVKGEYYDNETFSGAPHLRNDAAICFGWKASQTDSLFKAASYSVRWTALLTPLYAETYTFYVPNDKNIAVWVNDVPLITAQTKAGKYNERSATLELKPGEHYFLKVEYHNRKNADVHVRLAWSSASQYKQIIPMSQLFHK